MVEMCTVYKHADFIMGSHWPNKCWLKRGQWSWWGHMPADIDWPIATASACDQVQLSKLRIGTILSIHINYRAVW